MYLVILHVKCFSIDDFCTIAYSFVLLIFIEFCLSSQCVLSIVINGQISSSAVI